MSAAGNAMQHIRFIDFCHKDQNDFRYTVALIWSTSDSAARQVIYECAEEVVRQTGWYPLPQGARRTILFLDATMSGREFGAGATDSAGAVLESFKRASDVFVISSDAEQLLYAYLDLFQRTKDDTQLRNRVSFIVTKRLKRVFRLVHAAFMGGPATISSSQNSQRDSAHALYVAPYCNATKGSSSSSSRHHAPYRIWFAA